MSSRYIAGPTTIRFSDEYFDHAQHVRDLDVGVPVDLVVMATWAGDDIALRLSSTTKSNQAFWKRGDFFQHYNPEVALVRRIVDETEQGMETACWLYLLDASVIGEDRIDDKIRELVSKHNSEVDRIRRLGLDEEHTKV